MFGYIAGAIVVTLITGLLIRYARTRLPRSEAFVDFTPLRDASDLEPDFTRRLQQELAQAGSVQRAYLLISDINDKSGVLTLALRFFADSLDENLLRRLDTVNTEFSGGKRLMAMLPLGEFDERQALKVAAPMFDPTREPR